MTPADYNRIDTGDRLGIRFGNLNDNVTFTHPCVVVAREDGVLRLVPEPLHTTAGSIGGKDLKDWLPASLLMGRPGLSRRAEWFERSADAIAREHQIDRESRMATILHETGHVDDEGGIVSDLGALLTRLESLGFKLPEPHVPSAAEPSAQESALLQELLTVTEDEPKTGRPPRR